VRASAVGAAAVFAAFLLGSPAAADDPSPTPHPTSTHRAHHSARTGGPDRTATPTPVHSGSHLAGLPGIDGRVVALGSVLGLGILVGVLGLRRD
jgi:hypothetical protein